MSLLARMLPRTARLPRIMLGDWPTDVVRLPQLGKQLHCELWAKRDDRSGVQYGGNKLRKLELLLADARQARAATLVTVGGFGSNHIAATAFYGAQHGFRTHAYVFPQPLSATTQQNAQVATSAGAMLSMYPSRTWLPWALAWTWRVPAPYLIGPGGSSPLGTLGYVLGAIELKQQILQNELPAPREIVVPLGSGGTAAGLIVGCAIARIPARVLAVRVVERPLCNATLLRILVERTRRFLQKLGENPPPAGEFQVLNDYAGDHYGQVTAAASSSVELAQHTEGLQLDTTYSAKALAALRDRCDRNTSSGPVLFWLTANSRSLATQRNRSPTSDERRWAEDSIH